jgi:hypothetical protein
MTRLPDDFWAVNEEDAKVGILQLIVAFLTFGLLLAAFLGIILLIWASTP